MIVPLAFLIKKTKDEGKGKREHTRNDKRNGVINKTETQRYIKVRVFSARIHPFNAAIYPAIKKPEGRNRGELASSR